MCFCEVLVARVFFAAQPSGAARGSRAPMDGPMGEADLMGVWRMAKVKSNRAMGGKRKAELGIKVFFGLFCHIFPSFFFYL